MLKSLAEECGFGDFPEKKPNFPNDMDGLDERIGFEHHVPVDQSNAAHGDKEEEEEEEKEPAEDSDREEMIDLLTENAILDAPGDDTTNEMDLDDTDLEPNDVFVFGTNVDVSLCVPTVIDNERTCDTFKRKTQNAHWVPFAHPKDSATFTE